MTEHPNYLKERLKLKNYPTSPYLSDYELDYNSILYSHAFRRLRHKTQVFFFPKNDHVCTRLDHSLYVSSISSTVCNGLNKKGIPCDSSLASAIAIGHDLGHTMFGHAGEKKLNELASDIGGFKHEIQSLRIVDKIEITNEDYLGINLTFAVRDGIANHNGESRATTLSPRIISSDDDKDLYNSELPCTLEGCIVRLVDKVAYLGRDIEDAIFAELLEEKGLPAEISARIGTKNGELINFFVSDIIENSSSNRISLSKNGSDMMTKMFDFNYSEIYNHPDVELYKEHADEIIDKVYDKLLIVTDKYKDNLSRYNNDKRLCVKYLGDYIWKRKAIYFIENADDNDSLRYKRIIIDFLSTLTDRFIFEAFTEFFMPKPII